MWMWFAITNYFNKATSNLVHTAAENVFSEKQNSNIDESFKEYNNFVDKDHEPITNNCNFSTELNFVENKEQRTSVIQINKGIVIKNNEYFSGKQESYHML